MNIISEEYCSGCTACKNICPQQAINMNQNKEGFFYPQIDKKKCVSCSLCEKVCPLKKENVQEIKNKLPNVYAVKHKNEDIRKKSSSGGAFSAMAEYILANNGIIYGAILDEKLNVIHKRITTKEELDKVRGSKYVQSDLKNIFKEIKKDIQEKNKRILFIGTPCQIAGLKTFLGSELTNQIILCDLVCHGVPSPLIWEEHRKFLENKYKRKIKWYNFRDKSNGWHIHTEQVVLENEKIDNKSIISQIYKQLFHSKLIFRPSCYNCKFADLARTGDITIGDFWEINKTLPDFDDNKGISLILINNEKGQELFKNIKKDIIYKKSNVKDCIQPQLQYPVSKPKKREKFWNDYYNKGYNYILNKYTKYGIYFRIKVYIKQLITKGEKICKHT